MAQLTSIEKWRFERLFGMRSGYVMDFSNRTFSEFMLDCTGLNIYDEKYNYDSGWKANRLRAFWNAEPDRLVGFTLLKLLEHWRTTKQLDGIEITEAEQSLHDECSRICDRLTNRGMIETVDAIRPYEETKEWALLSSSIRKSIEDNEPEVALDRLHTYLVKYVRSLCDRHGISYAKATPLQGLFGSYLNHRKSSHGIHSRATEIILKSTASIVDALNQVRNESSFAHDNPLLSHNESILILSHASACIRFIEAIESEDPQASSRQDAKADVEEIPF